MQNRTLCPCFAAVNRIFIPVTARFVQMALFGGATAVLNLSQPGVVFSGLPPASEYNVMSTPASATAYTLTLIPGD
jgi:hypothetical protein